MNAADQPLNAKGVRPIGIGSLCLLTVHLTAHLDDADLTVVARTLLLPGDRVLVWIPARGAVSEGLRRPRLVRRDAGARLLAAELRQRIIRLAVARAEEAGS